MDVVPEFAKPGEPQILVGDPASPVIDHENEPASQQQQPYQTEKPADHASPCNSQLPQAGPGLTGELKKFNLASALTALRRTLVWARSGPESVDAAKAGLYKSGNGGGRNPAADVL
jgi:hypothetical protein